MKILDYFKRNKIISIVLSMSLLLNVNMCHFTSNLQKDIQNKNAEIETLNEKIEEEQLLKRNLERKVISLEARMQKEQTAKEELAEKVTSLETKVQSQQRELEKK